MRDRACDNSNLALQLLDSKTSTFASGFDFNSGSVKLLEGPEPLDFQLASVSTLFPSTAVFCSLLVCPFFYLMRASYSIRQRVLETVKGYVTRVGAKLP